MLGATAVGVAAIRWDWPRAPLLLALVLGDIAERYLFLSYSLYEWRWLGRPLVLAFAILTIGDWCGRCCGDAASQRHAVASRGRAGRHRLSHCGVWVLYQAAGWPFRTAVFPAGERGRPAGLVADEAWDDACGDAVCGAGSAASDRRERPR